MAIPSFSFRHGLLSKSITQMDPGENIKHLFETNLSVTVKSHAAVYALYLKEKYLRERNCIYIAKDANHSNIQNGNSLKLSKCP